MLFKSYNNSVTSISSPATLVLLMPDESSGLCHQYAQEGYNVLHVFYPCSNVHDALKAAVSFVTQSATPSSSALIAYGIRSDEVTLIDLFRGLLSLKAVVYYNPLTSDATPLLLKDSAGRFIPTILHIAESQTSLGASAKLIVSRATGLTHNQSSRPPVRVFSYPAVGESPPFPLLQTPPALVKPGHNEHVAPAVRSAVNLSYTRTLELLRQELGPRFDLEFLWEQHTLYEFGERDTAKTMATMVKEPYVNHIPTITGGIGFDNLSRFYKFHFIPKSPPDTQLITVSRTIGADRLVDEMIFRCTHTTEVDWLLPGVPPTGKLLEIPLVAIVAFRGDKLTFE